jgi:3-deoxy-manno-octulosonate cytidylyltransferase (CMP-KDO synthetase)
MKNRAVAVIPARFHSTRLPAKILADIAGKPMIRHVYERVSSAQQIQRVLIAADSEEILHVARRWGGEVIMTDMGLPSGTARIASIIDEVDAQIVINVQGDQPLVEPELIDALVETLQKSSAEIATPVCPITEISDLTDPSIVKVVRGNNGSALYFSRAPVPYVRDAPMAEWLTKATFWAHHGIYGFRRHVLESFDVSIPPSPLEQAEKLEQLRFLEAGYSIHTIETSVPQIAVDTAEDLAQVRKIFGSTVRKGLK